jgi:hypothetical protein
MPGVEIYPCAAGEPGLLPRSSIGLKRFAIIVRKELHLAWRQRHRPSINQKVDTRYQLLSEFPYRFFPVEDKGSYDAAIR